MTPSCVRGSPLGILHEDLSLEVGPERFRREFHIASQLPNPHILSIFDLGEAGKLLSFVMTIVGGESLRARLARERQLPLRDGHAVLADFGIARVIRLPAGFEPPPPVPAEEPAPPVGISEEVEAS